MVARALVEAIDVVRSNQILKIFLRVELFVNLRRKKRMKSESRVLVQINENVE